MCNIYTSMYISLNNMGKLNILQWELFMSIMYDVSELSYQKQ